MTSPEFGTPTVRPPSPTTRGIGGPCAPARAEVDARCVEAERLVAAAETHNRTLRDARSEHAEAARLRESDAHLRDGRRLTDEKTAAQAEYRAALARADEQGAVQDAASIWLRRVDELNRQARQANDRADALAQQVMELERTLPVLEMAADAARISAEAAQMACLEARRTLAACEEDAGSGAASRVANGTARSQGALTPHTATNSEPTVSRARHESATAAARALMRGDRQTLLGLALRLAEETGFEAGRLQLLLIELREQILAKALDEFAFAFPADHPFWSQFSAEAARGVTASLASIGYRFDGTSAWVDSRAPQIRDLALALSYCGYDPRTHRRPAGQAAIDALWHGTTVRTDEYLLARAPDLALAPLVALLGPKASRLAELWDIWGRLRPLLMKAGSSDSSADPTAALADRTPALAEPSR